MPGYVAFLRGLNVGGHTVKMEHLRDLFEALGFASVSTFIASGNVRFEADDTDPATLERAIERHLQSALGYAVATFLRTPAEVAAIAASTPFPEVQPQSGDVLHVALLHMPPPLAVRERVLALGSERDLLRLDSRDLYWLRRGPFRESPLSGPALERAVGPTTVRNINTLRRLAEKRV